MNKPLPRRRFLSISAAAMACAGMPLEARPMSRWTGWAMGARASMTLSGGLPDTEARSIFSAVEQELSRLEEIFSLYRPGSQIRQLNAAGVLPDPAPELLEVLSLCDTLNAVSGRAFDPTVQPLWQAHATAHSEGRVLSPEAMSRLRSRIGWHHLSFGAREVRFTQAGCGLTLNGIAQGYITDRIAALLRRRGLSDILIDMGEIAALGAKPWQVGIAAPEGGIVDRITLQDRAVATSAPMGTPLVPALDLGHIFDPRDGMTRPHHTLISVSARSAALADGLSTAFCLMPGAELQACLTRFPDARLETVI